MQQRRHVFVANSGAVASHGGGEGTLAQLLLGGDQPGRAPQVADNRRGRRAGWRDSTTGVVLDAVEGHSRGERVCDVWAGEDRPPLSGDMEWLGSATLAPEAAEAVEWEG